jgi:Spy/CpxP family protein refolding chaperone
MQNPTRHWRISLGLIVAASFLFLALPAPAPAASRNGEPLVQHWWERPKVVQALKISDEQIKRIRELTREDVRQSNELKRTLRQERAALNELFAADSLDEKGIAVQTEKILSTFASLTKIEADIQFKAVKELTAEQRRDLVEMKDQAEETIRKRLQDWRDNRKQSE